MNAQQLRAERERAFDNGRRLGRDSYDSLQGGGTIEEIERIRDDAERELPFALVGWHSEGFDLGYGQRRDERA